VNRLAVVAVAVLAVGCGRRNFEALMDGAASTGSDADGVDGAVCGVTFCDSFERNGNIADGWTNTETTGMVEVSLIGGALNVTLDQTGEAYFLEKALAPAATRVRVRMKLGYSTTNAGTNCELDLVALAWPTGACSNPFGFYIVRDGSDQLTLQETNGNATCTGNRDNFVPELTSGLHDVELIVTTGAVGVARVRLKVDETTLVDRNTLQAVPTASASLLRLGGVIVRNGAGTWTITYDDVEVDVQ
jgi:hypothetical protein